jgi:methionyl-tRNA formyltransferase
VRLVFLGSPPEAQGALRALHDAGHEIPLVVTQPDRKRGRGGDLVPSPVKRTATELGLSVVTPERCKEALDDIAGTGAELGVVVAFGQLIPPSVLSALPSGYVNVHFSLLPRWRGAAPVERAMLAGDDETGVCLMQLEAGLDTGPVYACRTIPITPDDTAGDLRRRLADLGTELLLAEIDSIPGRTPTPQQGEETYAAKLSVEEFAVDWARPAAELARLVMAGNPKPGAWTTAKGARLKLLRARAEDAAAEPAEPVEPARPGTLVGPGRVATGAGILVLNEVQPEGKAAMPATAWAAGFRGDRLGA